MTIILVFNNYFFLPRFLGKQPILISMKTKNVRQRARFIWSNITILNENIEKFIKQDIFHHNTERDNDNKNGTFNYITSLVIYLT